jgi:predicted HicB family RNase H-like nuclease
MEMSRSDDRYSYRITWSEDDMEYVGLCTEFPSLSWLANNPEAALQGIRKAVNNVVADMRNSGELPPAPLSGRSYSGKFIVRIPPEVHRDLALKAAEDGISLNRLVSLKLSRV